jgi:esterase/lipase
VFERFLYWIVLLESMKKPVLKAYYGGMFFDFVLQDRKADAIVILPGFPGKDDFRELIGIFFDRGYHVFVPKYKGSYQSLGTFLSKNPVDDLVAFTEHLERGEVKSLWDNEKMSFIINKKIVAAWGFSASIALGLAAKSVKYSHIILASPIWDFSKHNEKGDEYDLVKITEFVRRAYKNCYRFKFKDINKKLSKFSEIKPEYYVQTLAEFPILVFHDPNDNRVAFSHTKEILPLFSNITYIEHYLGHGLNDYLISAFWKEIDKFVKINYVD